ncbi:MAG: metallophosphoesterase [Victivallaceae bacterium]|nr:metallophosphoesterase [Victivallaceae bacterium]
MKFAAIALAALVTGCAAGPNLRVGIVSDVQGTPAANDYGMENLELAFEQLKDRNIDVLLIGGDLANAGQEEVYDNYRAIFSRVFRDRPPWTLQVMGNHDFWKKDTPPETSIATFCLGTGQGHADVYHMVINEYDFIAMSPDAGECNGVYSENTKKLMAENLKLAVKRDPHKPIFVITHQHPANTVYGSDAWGNSDIFDMLKDYPQVIAFSGHSHYPLEDERTIWQGDFTAAGTSSLNYCEMEKGKVNGSVPPHASDCVQMIYMEIYKNRVEMTRLNVREGKEIKPDEPWVVELPYDKNAPVYSAARAEEREAPEWPFFAAAPTIDFRRGNAFVAFDAAKHPDFVHSYAIKVFHPGESEPITELLYFSDFYRGIDRMSPHPEFTLPPDLLIPGEDYKIQIFPIESFGKRGDALELEFSVPSDFVFVIPKKEK